MLKQSRLLSRAVEFCSGLNGFALAYGCLLVQAGLSGLVRGLVCLVKGFVMWAWWRALESLMGMGYRS